MNTIKPEKKLLGVCAWLAGRFEIDVTIVRVAFVVAAILGMGSPVLIYFILFFIMKMSN